MLGVCLSARDGWGEHPVSKVTKKGRGRWTFLDLPQNQFRPPHVYPIGPRDQRLPSAEAEGSSHRTSLGGNS